MNAAPVPPEPPSPKLLGFISLPAFKTFGYLISTTSVILLAIVSWPKAKEDPVLLACLVGGALTSIMGMFCRWLSYEIEERAKQRNQAS
ncbi:hypothetical protein WG901_08270 [Novosphingobium sp. PS1R-30]|uniref:Uncharacterized protein n=1 Tax=Novosphingobium anseongense TaxID=3133436 RepID=A0ABU8RV89_9SPHN